MKKHFVDKVQKSDRTQTKPPLQWSYSLIIITYGIITVITPGLGAWDSNGTKFLSLSLLNLLAFIFLMNQRAVRKNIEVKLSFFNTRIGFVYILFLLISLLSFIKAINIIESFVTFSKFFTVFSATYIIAIILRSNKRYMDHFCVWMVFLLIIDCLTVFYNVVEYVNGYLQSIVEITSVYSNKNILTSAIFVKIPFALWLISFRKGWSRVVGIIAFFLAFIAILFLSTRAFYLGIVLISFAFITFTTILKARENLVKKLNALLPYIGIIVAAILIYSAIQFLVFSKLRQEIWNKDVVSRIGSIKEELSGFGRIAEWKMSGKLIKENPILGVGIGNWKICVLKYENQVRDGFVFLHANHNDFIQITAETGFIGGLLFITLIILTGFNFIAAFFRSDKADDVYKYLFIPAFGMLAYSVDAFFNFPFDRPEIVSLFAIFLGTAIGLSPSNLFFTKTSPDGLYPNSVKRSLLANIPAYLFIPLMVGTIFVLYLNFKSLKFQFIVIKDLVSEQHKLQSGNLQNEFPLIPTIDAVDEPIAVIKARYLNFEGKYKEAIDLLKNDHSSPYYANNEYFLAMAYSKMGESDSALVHYYKAFRQKPLCFDYVYSIGRIHEQQGKLANAINIVDSYLFITKTNSSAWGYAADLYLKSGHLKQAIILVDSGLRYRPKNDNLIKQKEALERLLKIEPYESIYNSAVSAFQKEDFSNAARFFSDFIEKKPGLLESFEYRANCYYMMKEYQKSISDIDKLLNAGIQKANLFNLRGAAFHELGQNAKACEDFRKAINLGDSSAGDNYKKYCNTKKQ